LLDSYHDGVFEAFAVYQGRQVPPVLLLHVEINDALISVQADDFYRWGMFAGQGMKEKVTGLQIVEVRI
jgi:hypothetical protein